MKDASYFAIERKTDFIAFAAFLLSVSSVFVHIWFYWQGAKIQLFPPDKLLIHHISYPNDPLKYLGIVAPMSYVNSGQVGYNGVINWELVSFQLDGKTYEQGWQNFVFSDWTPDQDNKDPISNKESAGPFPVNAASSASHETAFAPLPIRCTSGKTECPNQRTNYLLWQSSQLKLIFQ